MNSLWFFFAQFLEARIVPERIEHRIEPEQRGSKRRATQSGGVRYGYQLELRSGEVFTLRRDLHELATLHRTQGIPQGHAKFVKVQTNFADLLQLTKSELDNFLSANKSDALKVFARVIRWLSETPEIAAKLSLDETQLPTLNELISRENLNAVMDIWAKNSDNSDEEFWQKEFSKHSFVLGLLFSYPIVIIKGKAYVGGKRVDNKHGNLVDFLASIPSSRTAVLIEIKSPAAALLGSEYRDDVFSPSADLVGAISQVIHYQESLMDNPNLRRDARLSPSTPRCVIITGCCRRELADDEYRQRSFERFRERLLGVTIITFDELFDRIKTLRSLFE